MFAPRADRDLAAGYALVVPGKPIAGSGADAAARIGWWRIDPKTGQTIGVMDNGFNAAMTEDTVVRTRSSEQLLYDRVDQLCPRIGYRGWTSRGTTPHWIAQQMGIAIRARNCLGRSSICSTR